MNWIWIGVIVALLLIELVSLNFTAIWFVISAIISFILLKFNNDYIVQVLTFVILGSLLMIIIRPKVIDKLIKIRDEFISKLVKKYKFFTYLVPKEIRKKDLVKKKQKSK